MGVKILNNRNKVNICDMCQKVIASDLAFYKIKRRFVYQDYDGWWHGEGSVLICQNCIDKIREELNYKENKK